MKFSVIIPAHNAERFLGQCLQSVADQELAALDVVVAADNCSDDTANLARSWSDRLPMRIVECAHRNAAAARNEAIEHAQGDWLAFLDADDYWLPSHLRKISVLVAPGDAGYMAIQDFLYQDGSIHPVSNKWPITEPTSGLPADRFVECWQKSLNFAMTTVSVRTDRFHEAGGFDPSQVRRHDFDMFLRTIHGHTWAYRPESVAIHRMDNPGSISRTNWASSELYQLKGLKKNLPLYPGLEPIVRDAARRVMSSSLTDGSAEDRKHAKALAWPYLSAKHKAVFSLGLLVPGAFAALNKARRRKLREQWVEEGIVGTAKADWLEKGGEPTSHKQREGAA